MIRSIFSETHTTGGNRLMGFAMMLALSRQPPEASKKIQLVYRDKDAKPFEMQIVESRSAIYRNGKRQIKRCPKELRKRLKWKSFWKLPLKSPITKEDILK